jgi:hypothetical protein
MDLLINKDYNVKIVSTKGNILKSVSHYKTIVKFVKVMIMTLINAPKRTWEDVAHDRKHLQM